MATPIVPWVGGKRRLAKRILPVFPAHECYVEPFAGGAALFFLKEPSDVEVLNDINGELINLYRVVKHHLEEFVRQFKWALISRQLYGWLKKTGHSPELKLYEDGKPCVNVPYEAYDAYWCEIEHFADCVDQGVAPRISPEESRNVMRVIRAIEASLSSGKVVPTGWVD